MLKKPVRKVKLLCQLLTKVDMRDIREIFATVKSYSMVNINYRKRKLRLIKNLILNGVANGTLF